VQGDPPKPPSWIITGLMVMMVTTAG
jgi:hypothetical protein